MNIHRLRILAFSLVLLAGGLAYSQSEAIKGFFTRLDVSGDANAIGISLPPDVSICGNYPTCNKTLRWQSSLGTWTFFAPTYHTDTMTLNGTLVMDSSARYVANSATSTPLQVYDVEGLCVANGAGALTDCDGTIKGGSVQVATSGALNLDGTTNNDNGMTWNGTQSSWRAGGATPVAVIPGQALIKLGNSGSYVTQFRAVATASLPTCDATYEGSIAYDSTLNAHVACNDKDGSLGWDVIY